MKRAPYPPPPVVPEDHEYWRSLSELEKRPEIQEALDREFPDGASELPEGPTRRRFLSLAGATLALGGLAGCRRPVELILPYSKSPEEIIPGKPLFFASTLAFGGTAIGVLVESHDGRPTKIEGNPKHPESLGATSAFVQAMVLDLYDPDRAASPTENGNGTSVQAGEAMLRKLGEDLRKKMGKGVAVITEAHRSPALATGLQELKEALPEAKFARWEAFGSNTRREGARLAFGKRFDTSYDLDKARRVLLLDADLFGLEGSSVKHARGVMRNRKVETSEADMTRLYVAESAFSSTGGCADHRLRATSRDVARVAFFLGQELARFHKLPLAEDVVAAMDAKAQGLSDRAKKWVKGVAKDLASAKGRAVVVAGDKQPAAVHAACHLINVVLATAPGLVTHVAPLADVDEHASLAEVAKAFQAGQIDSVLVFGGNPAFDGPADYGLEAAIKKAAVSVHVADSPNETSAACKWVINRAHPLETWGDALAEDGTISVQQPLIEPMYGGKSDLEVIDLLLGRNRSAHEILQQAWRGRTFFPGHVADEKTWRRALHDGLLEGGKHGVQAEVVARSAETAAAVKALALPEGTEISFNPDPHAYDGRFANNGWLQELPDSMHKLTWGNTAVLSKATADKLGVKDGDILSITVDGRAAKVPALIGPGQADDSIAVTIGQGRRVVGRVGKGVGFDTTPLRGSAALGFAGGAQIQKTGEATKLSRTQEHFLVENRPVIRETTLAEYKKDPKFVEKYELPHPATLSLWYDYAAHGPRWAMTYDIGACTGCNACVVACQSENNISVIGPEGVQLSREMQWLRIDRYFTGPQEDPQSIAQPMTCQQCENAPCEQVCPVAATTHSPEGLNDMAYNRCIGTKYCANNCPFKVRRFNYFNYNKEVPESRKMQFNPNVTVRFRGVMEKCTYCVQRIQEAKIAAKREGKDNVDREHMPKTACQQVCPTEAIHFGDLNDYESEIAKSQALPRAYKLLVELNIRPRASYLARIKNPNPELEGV